MSISTTTTTCLPPNRSSNHREKSRAEANRSAAANLIRFSRSLLDSNQVGRQQLRMPLSNVLFARIRQFNFTFKVGTRKLLQVAASPSIRIDQHARIKNPARVERLLRRLQCERESIGTLAVVPWAMVSPNRVMMRDRAA